MAACPTCGGEVRFGSGAPYCVCRYCKSLLVKSDASVESIGRVADVPEDVSPLQLGTAGRFEQRNFSVVGRLRKVWAEGSWSEWCVRFEDQSFGWLAEAQGDLVMTFEQPPDALADAPAADHIAGIEPGTAWRIGGRRFAVSDVKPVSCLGAEGELSSIFAPGERILSVDLRGEGFEFATVEFRQSGITPFVGRFVDFGECRFSNLRQIDWDDPG